MSSRQAALKTAREHVAEERPYCRVTGLLDLETDYLVETELIPPETAWPLGPPAMLISKQSNELREEVWGNVIPRINKLEETGSKAQVSPKRVEAQPLDMDQVIRIQVEIMQGRTWETKTERVPDTEEARECWERMSVQIAEGKARGWTPKIPNELPM